MMSFLVELLIRAGLVPIVLGILLIALKFTAGDMFDDPLWPYDAIASIVIGIGLTAWSIKEMRNDRKKWN